MLFDMLVTVKVMKVMTVFEISLKKWILDSFWNTSIKLNFINVKQAVS